MAQSARVVEYIDHISGYDCKQSDGEAWVMLELWEILLLLPPGPLWSGVVAPDRVSSMGQIKLFDI